MEPKILKIFIFAFLIYCVSARRWTSGGGSRTSGGYRPSRPSTSSWGHTPTHQTSYNRPSSTSFNSGRTSSTNFLHAESGRPSLPANSHPSYSAPRPSYTPSAPPQHTSHTQTSNFGKPSSVVNERHQQNSASVSHNNPYERQPAYNPHVSSGSTGSHSSPPYPVHQPNHPLPSSIGTPPASSGVYHPTMTGSAYQPHTSGVYHPSQSGVYQPHTSGVYHPSQSGVYHPQPSGVYHPQPSGVYHPQPSAGVYHPQPSAGVYHPPAYHPPTYSQAPQHTVYVMPGSSRQSSSPGIGTYIASGVAGGVAAGATNAIVDHAISSIFRPNSHGVHTYPSAPAPGTPTTSITNNYYYSNGAPAPAPGSGSSNNNNAAAPVDQPIQTNSYNGQPAQVAPSQNNAPAATNNQGTLDNRNNVSPTLTNGVANRLPQKEVLRPDDDNTILDDELMKLTEELFDSLNGNVNQYVELNLQKRVTIVPDAPLTDEASEPLFIIKPGLDSIPTVSKLKALYDSYQRNGTQKENISSDRQSKESAFLDEIMRTPVMIKTLSWLSEKRYVKRNQQDHKELLKNTWFTVYGETTSPFERIFLSEYLGESGIAGMQDWIYVAHLEKQNNADYMGYNDMLSLSGKGALLKANFKSEGVPMQGLTMFVGTPPELEMALYTICLHARFNGFCPISLGGAKFFILTQAFKENDKYLIDAGFPTF